MQKHIIGGWICDFDKILWTDCNNKNLIWIYRWTRRETWSQPAQPRWVGGFLSNCTRVDNSVVLTTRTANMGTVWFGPGTGPEAMVRNGFYQYRYSTVWPRSVCQAFFTVRLYYPSLVPPIHPPLHRPSYSPTLPCRVSSRPWQWNSPTGQSPSVRPHPLTRSWLTDQHVRSKAQKVRWVVLATGP